MPSLSHSSEDIETHSIDANPPRRLTIGVVLPDFGSESMIHEIWTGITDVAREEQIHILGLTTGALRDMRHYQAGHGRNLLWDLHDPALIDGLLTFQFWESAKWFQQMCRRYLPDKPVVPVWGKQVNDYHLQANDAEAMQKQMQHLIEVHGYRRIAYIGRPPGDINPWLDAIRRQTYQEMLAQFDLPAEKMLLCVPPSDSPDLPFRAEDSVRWGEKAVRLLCEERGHRPGKDIEAVVAFDDLIACGVIRGLQQRGVHVPDEIAVVGFGDRDEARFTLPRLTTMRNPWYQAGREAATLLLDCLHGNRSPREITIPAPVLIRRSCGCFSSVIRQAGGPDRPGETADDRPLSSYKEAIVQLLGDAVTDSAWKTRPDWFGQMFDAFVLAVNDEASPVASFLLVLEQGVYQAAHSNAEVCEAQHLLSVLRTHLLPHTDDQRTIRGQALLSQARVLVGEIALWNRDRRQDERDRMSDRLRDIGQQIIGTFDVAQILNILAEHLPRLGISTGFLSLYANPSNPVEGCRLMLAYTPQGRIELPREGRPFAVGDLVPRDLIPADCALTLVVEPLFFEDTQIGLFVCEDGLPDRRVYDILRGEISSALYGAMLMGEITRRKYILDTFMANVPDSIYFKDRESRIIHANAAHARVFGLHDPAEEYGKTDFDFFPEAQARQRYEQEQAIMRSGEPLLNYEESDESGRCLLTTKMPLRDEYGDIVGTFGISRDISELKRIQEELAQYREHLEDLVQKRTAELHSSNAQLHQEVKKRTHAQQALQQSEEQYRLLAENVRDGLAIVLDQRIVLVNAVFTAMFGYTRDYLLHTDLLMLFPPAERERFRKHLYTEQMPLKHSEWQVEMVTKTGQQLWAEIEQTPIVWNASPARLLTIRDISEHKSREQQLEEERSRLERENLTLRSTIKERFRFGELVGKSPAIQRVYELIISAASSDVNVLIMGESGTGKELIARTLHQVSHRKKQAFVPVNCASVPDSLFEREFFGHRKGTFTGADRDKPGYFDQAHRGTLFLDEVTELTGGMQAKLLRVLQDGEYTPLGSTVSKTANVLIVAATNKSCQEEIAAGRLRQDFYYRIGVIEVSVPTLRERKDDLPLLIDHILAHNQQRQLDRYGTLPNELPTDLTMLPRELVQALYAYDWPGNVRELQNVLLRYAATKNLPSMLSLLNIVSPIALRAVSPTERFPDDLSLPEAVELLEKEMIDNALQRTQHNIAKTAQLLGLHRSRLYRKLEQYGLKM